MEVTRLFEIPFRQHKKFPRADALCAKENGEWKKYSTADFTGAANTVSNALLALGIKKGDCIATISNNRPEWNFVDIGIMQVGAVHVPIYPNISESEYKFILNDAGIKIVFVSSKELFNKVSSIKKDIPSLKEIYTFDNVEGASHFRTLLDIGQQTTNNLPAGQAGEQLEAVKSTVGTNDLATLLYTSGTTGTPKGVMLSHANIISNVEGVEHLPPVTSKDTALSFLPLCHSYERVLSYLYMYHGVGIYYAEAMEKIADNLKEVRPQIFGTVPRLLEKVYDKIVAKGNDLSGIKRKLFFWALNLGLKYELYGANGWWYETQLKLANKLIFSKWREALGGNVRAVVSGGAALQPRLARVFTAAQINVLEGYGLTETSPVIAVNNFEERGRKFGTVGPVLKNVQVKIAEDGEILSKGPNLMMGYYNRPDLTAEVIDKDGWFHTGDIGTIEDGKYLKITDRKKEIFKTSGGKYIAPQVIENKLKESPFIEQAMVVGEGKKYVAVLIVPAFAHLKQWCEQKNIPAASNAGIIKNTQVNKRIMEEVEEVNKTLGKFESIKKIELVESDWGIDSGELTPTLKLKRKFIANKFKDKIESLFVS